MDSPWHRLPWTLPAALLILAAALWGAAYIMYKPTYRPVVPPPIDAQLIELPAPVAADTIEPEPPAAVEQPTPPPPVIPRQVPVKPQVTPRTKQKPVPQKAKVITNAADVPGNALTAPSEEAPVAENTSSNSSTQAGSYDPKGSSRGDLHANSGARAIVQPMPKIPEDLRAEAFKSAALARFHIAVDGSAEVELAKPTPFPRLNRILLDSLKQWRFMPAIKSGVPVASTEEILVKIEVK
ncbi:MAG: energy transducer TonB [Syntrophobacteraceae bacterium]